MPYIDHNCTYCGGPVIRRGNESSSGFNKRQFCSRQCAGQARAGLGVRQTMYCKICGDQIIKRAHESLPAYKQRKLCSREDCKSEWKSRVRRHKPLTNIPLLAVAMMGWRA